MIEKGEAKIDSDGQLVLCEIECHPVFWALLSLISEQLKTFKSLDQTFQSSCRNCKWCSGRKKTHLTLKLQNLNSLPKVFNYLRKSDVLMSR